MIHSYQTPLTGSKIGVVFGSFAPLLQGHLDLIMRAKKENDGGCLVIVCGYSGDKGEPLMPHDKRYRYVREFFRGQERYDGRPRKVFQRSIQLRVGERLYERELRIRLGARRCGLYGVS